MSESAWRWGRGWLRGRLARVLPPTEWALEYLEELDDEVRRRAAGRPGPALTVWYLGQLLSPRAIALVRALRMRARSGHETRGGGGMSGFWMDLRHGVRGLAREPWGTALIVTTLGVGIGSVSAMYGVADRLFLSGPPGVASPEALVHVTLRFDEPSGTRTSPWIPWATARAVVDGVDAFESGSLYRVFDELGRVAERTGPLSVAAVDHRYFALLGARPVVGRVFRSEGERDGAVLSHALAVEQFGSPRAALGATVRVGGFSGSVVGVAEPGFAGPALDRIDMWIPPDTEHLANRNWWVLGRLLGDRSAATATEEAAAIHDAVDPGRSFQWAREGRIDLAPIHADPTGARTAERSIARLLLVVVGLVLLIAWFNVLNLLLARVTNRREEVLVRLALGVGRWRLVRLLLVESLMLSALGGLFGLPVAWAEGLLVRDVLLPDVAWQGAILDGRLLGVAILAAVVSAAVLGMLPARQATRADLSAGLREAGPGASVAGARLQTGLATAQVALSAALLLCAGLFVKSFNTMRVTELGVDAEEVWVVNLRSLDFELGGGAEREEEMYERALRSLEPEGAGRRVALSVGLPFLTNFGMSVHVDGRDSVPELPGGGPFISVVSGGYFETLGTEVLVGRGISETDVGAGTRVTVIGASTADAIWPDVDPIGQCVRIGAASDPCYEVIGVAEDVHRMGYREPPSMQFYLPLGSSRSFRGSTLIVRPPPGTGVSEAVLRREITAAVPEVEYVEVRRLATLLDPEIRPWKLGAVMLSMVATLAIVMSLAGVVGVLSYLVAQRRREIGVRMALGASRASIRGLVLRLGVGAGGAGVAVGFGGVLASGRWLDPLLFETRVFEPVVMLAVGTLLVGAAALACLAPAAHAAGVDPVRSLRAEG